MVLANIWFPDERHWGRMVVAVITDSAAGSGAAKTITIPNNYPPIDLGLSSPVLAIFAVQTDATLLALGNTGCAIAGQMGVAPTADGEFFITGARTLQIWKTPAELQAWMVCYISKGSGQET
jgi:hypothetical protein